MNFLGFHFIKKAFATAKAFFILSFFLKKRNFSFRYGIVIGNRRLNYNFKFFLMRMSIITAGLLMAIVAITTTVSNDRTKQLNDMAYISVSHYDTVPSDTTKPDSAAIGLLSFNVLDTVPSDTTKPDSTSFLAYHNLRDTVPTDTTTKDTMSFATLAYNIVRDTVPADTTTRDSTTQYLAIVR